MEKFKKDLKRKELIPIKVLMFLIYGGQATLYPYFTVHLKSLNVSIQQTAIIFAVQPVIALVAAPAIGMLADKIGNFRLIFSFFLTFSAVVANMLLFVPPVPQTDQSFHLTCSSQSESVLKLQIPEACNIQESLNNSYANMSMTFQCYQECGNITSQNALVLLEEDGSDCWNHCKNTTENGCTSIQQDTCFDFYLEVKFLKLENDTVSIDPNFNYLITYNNVTYKRLMCPCSFLDCNTNCNFLSKDTFEMCSKNAEEKFSVTFWSYLGIRLFITLGIGLVNGLFDSASMAIIQNLKADVGFQRFWSTVGMCIFAPISGYFVDEYDNFKPCFFMYGILYIVAAVISLKLDLNMKLPSESPLKNLGQLLRNPEVDILLFQIAVLGICWGFLENFLFWFLERELGSNTFIMGLTVTVGSGTGLFMALIATWCTKKLGYVNVIIAAFAAYTVRFFGYALAQNAYICLIFEMMENFTVTLLTVGVTMYCTELSSLEMLTTVMTLWNGLHVISGRAFGSLLGGFLVEKFGFRQTFKFFAYGSATFGGLYALMYITWLRRWRRNNRKPSVTDDRKSSLDSEEEGETVRNQVFASFSLHCSFDSPIIVSYAPDPPPTEFRRRALSHDPVVPKTSLTLSRVIPRHAVSFTEGNIQRPYTIVLKTAKEHKNPQTISSVEEENLESVTKF